MKVKINRGMRRILEALEKYSELRYTPLRAKAKLSDPVLSDYLKQLKSNGFVNKPSNGYRITPKGRLELNRILDSTLVGYSDILLRSTIEPKFPDSLPRDIRAPVEAQLSSVLPNGEWSGYPDPLFEYMPPLGPVAVTLYGSKQLRQSLDLPLNGSSFVSESKASQLLNEPWRDVGKYVRQLLFWLLIGYVMDLVESNSAPDFSLQLGMTIRLNMQGSPEVRHRIAAMLFWCISLPQIDPAIPQFSLPKLLTFMEKKLGMVTDSESKLLQKLIEGEERAEFERKCLELALKHFELGGCL